MIYAKVCDINKESCNGTLLKYRVTKAYTDEVWQIEQVRRHKVKRLQDLTLLTQQSNKVCNNIIRLEEQEAEYKQKIRDSQSRRTWQRAMAASKQDDTSEQGGNSDETSNHSHDNNSGEEQQGHSD